MRKKHNTKLNIILGLFSVITNLGLFALKLWAGLVSGSVAIIADAWHTLSDSASSVVLIIGSKIAQKPADREHPFGHGRVEHITAIIIGVLLFTIAVEFAVDAVKHFINRDKAQFGTLAIVVTIISIIGKEVMAQASFWGYRKNGSAALKADAWHHRTDALSSVVVLVGIFLGNYFWWVDSVMGLIVAFMIAFTGWQILRNEFDVLIGKAISPELVQQMKQISFDATGRDNNLHHFHIHQYGDHTEISFHISLPADYTILQAHSYCTKIEKAILEQLHMNVTIHTDPEH